LIEEIVDLAEGLTAIALIGAGGIGKTSIALTVLHHDRVKQRFGGNRRFIRCDQFPATVAHLLNRLSKVTGAGIENPEDLTPLRPLLSSREMIVVLDNAESILDPEGADAAEIYALVEELSELPTLCLCITSRISTIPPECKTIEVPVLSMDAACRAFYHIYKYNKGSDIVNGILEQLDFHPLSITLLATVGHQNKWSIDRLAREWEKRRTSVLQTRHKKSLAAAIEISLASPMFQEFGPDARALLEVVAFFPQGIDENNANWLFPTIPNGIDTLDGFCVLSLTHRSNGFITMLAPLRDYLSPKDPKLSPLLCAVKEHYFIRMSVDLNPNQPEFGEAQWIRSEDINVEHLLDVFTTIDGDSEDVWDACADFMSHLRWHKNRPTVLRVKVEGLLDIHCCKLKCLYELSKLFGSIGNHVDCKRLLIHALRLERERGDDRGDGRGVARALRELADVNYQMEPCGEGEQQVKEALEIYERLGDTVQQAASLITLTRFSSVDAAEELLFRAIDLLPEKGEEFLVCESHLLLGAAYRSRGKMEKAVYHFEVALGIATSFDWHDQLFRIHSLLAVLFLEEDRLDDGHAHAERAMLYAVNNAFSLGSAMWLRALLWQRDHRLEEARSEVLRAADIFEKLGSSWGKGLCGKLLQEIREELNNPVTSGELCEFLQMMPLPACIDIHFQPQRTE
jgi:tetratricopeptide (TPR) repeat protein